MLSFNIKSRLLRSLFFLTSSVLSPIPRNWEKLHKWRAHALHSKLYSYHVTEKKGERGGEGDRGRGGEKERRRRKVRRERRRKISPVAAPASLSGLLVHVQGPLICLLKYQTSVLLLFTYPISGIIFPQKHPMYICILKKKNTTLF